MRLEDYVCLEGGINRKSVDLVFKDAALPAAGPFLLSGGVE